MRFLAALLALPLLVACAGSTGDDPAAASASGAVTSGPKFDFGARIATTLYGDELVSSPLVFTTHVPVALQKGGASDLVDSDVMTRGGATCWFENGTARSFESRIEAGTSFFLLNTATTSKGPMLFLMLKDGGVDGRWGTINLRCNQKAVTWNDVQSAVLDVVDLDPNPTWRR